jgi:outer membrane lipoprotein carrier protein
MGTVVTSTMRRPALTFVFLATALLAGHARSSFANAALASAPSASPPNVAQAVASVQNFYSQSTTFECDFQQQFTVKAYGQTKSSDGHVIFSRPGQMNWAYKNGSRVVSNGQTITIYDAVYKQMYITPVNASPYPAALSFLTGQGNLSSSFTFTLWPGNQLNFPGGFVLEGVPIQTTPAYSKVLFYVDAATSEVRRVLMIDGHANRNRFDFINPKANGAVAAGAFSFTPPPGTSIIQAGTSGSAAPPGRRSSRP